MDESTAKQSGRLTITEVQIVLSQTQLYYNDRQQCQVLLRVRCTRDGQPSILTETEKENIRIVDYQNPNGYVPFSEDAPPSRYSGWSAQRSYHGYSFYPSAAPRAEGDGGPQKAAPRQGPSEWFEYYLSADIDAQYNRYLWVSFSIYGDDKSVWRTTGYMTDPDGETYHLKHLDLRNNIELTAEVPVQYSIDNFQLDRRSLQKARQRHPSPSHNVPPGRTGARTPDETNAALFNDLVTLSIAAPGGRTIGVRSMDCVPAGMIHWVNNLPDTSNPCFTGYARPGETSIHWNPDVPTGSQPLPTLSAAVQGKGVFLLCGRVDIRRGDHTGPPRDPVKVDLIDEYGTQHTCYLAFAQGERDVLRIQQSIKARKQSGRFMLDEVEITLSHRQLYYNGRQQCRILLRVSCLRDGETSMLTETEKKNIRIVDYKNPNGYVPFSEDAPSDRYRGWSAQRSHHGYSFYPGLASRAEVDGDPEKAAPRQEPSEWLEFYLSADIEAQSNRSLWVSFSIYGDDGSVWRTTGVVNYPDGSLDYFPEFDLRENIALTAVTPVQYSIDNFQLDRRSLQETRQRSAHRPTAFVVALAWLKRFCKIRRLHVAPSHDAPRGRPGAHTSHETNAALFNDLVTLSIAAAAGPTIAIRSMDCVPAGMIHWVNNLPDTSNPCFTGYARPGETSIHWNPDVPTGSQPLPTLSAAVQGKGVFLLCGRADIRRGDHTDPPRAPVKVDLIDEYGTQHTCYLAFAQGERDVLRIQQSIKE